MNKIGWCDFTWNPVIGCKNNCKYCYAKKINDRFKFIKNWNNPKWREKSFGKKLPKKPQRIFVGSMSEIRYWNLTWVFDVLTKVEQYPQHTFQFLTKHPEVYSNFAFPKNCWLGITITEEKDFAKGISYGFICADNVTFLSIEPMLGKIDPKLFTNLDIDWVIIGAETGNRKGKVVPKREWIDKILFTCDSNNIPVYIKDNLSKHYDEYREYKEFPKEE